MDAGIVFFKKNYVIIIYLLLITLSVKLALSFFNKIYTKVMHTNKSKQFSWGKTLVKAAALPFKTLVWTLGITVGSTLVLAGESWVLAKVYLVQELIAVVCITWIPLSIVRQLGASWHKGVCISGINIDNNTTHLLLKLAQIIIVFMGLEASFIIMGFNLNSLLAIGSIGGAAIAFASQDLLSNFFGAIIIHLDKPFALGDSIEIGSDIKGKISSIGWRMTNIINQEHHSVYVPNSIFTKKAIKNLSHINNFVIKETICLDHDSIPLINKITTDIVAALKAHSKVDYDDNISAVLNQISLDGASIDVAVCLAETDKNVCKAIKHELLLAIHNIIYINGGKLARTCN